MKEIEERFADKSTWGPGPWQDEPDKAQWLDKETSYPCLIVRNVREDGGTGALCGYVGVPPGHPAFKKHYDEVEGISIHGGLTFADHCHEGGRICHVVEPGEPDLVWWLGFDCAHFMDYAPGLEAFMNELRKQEPSLPGRPHLFESIYRDFDYVKAECRDLARQLKEMEAP